MGFIIKLVNTIMNCVSYVTFSIFINGNPSKEFKPQRGLRQGDLLSPYLFILCVKVLCGLITKGLENGIIYSIPIAKNYLSISHIIFFC